MISFSPRYCPRAFSRTSGCKIPALANLSILGGRIFQYIPPLGSVLLQSLRLRGADRPRAQIHLATPEAFRQIVPHFRDFKPLSA